MNQSHSDRLATVLDVVRERTTCKLLGDPESPLEWTPVVLEGHRRVLEECLAAAGWAPFHFARNIDGVAEPWRAHLLSSDACRRLARQLPDLVEVPPRNRLRQLLAGCGALAIVTWLKVDDLDDAARQRHVNEEHLCAAAAYTQNLLLLLTAAGFGSYWASPGLLDSPGVRNQLELPAREALIAAVFCGFPDPVAGVCETLSGGNRKLRSAPDQWIRIIY
jgi:nitroreductase